MSKYVVQFNETNFDILKKYCQKYSLPNIERLINSESYIETESEEQYDNLEPWIQWYSFYTGLSYDQHKVYHLGDCLKNEHDNFIKNYADNNSVGVFGAMNLPPYEVYKIFIPDAWTESNPDISFSSRFVTSALKNIINSNAGLKIKFNDILGLLLLIGLPKSIQDFSILYKVFKSFFLRSRAHLAAYFDYYFLRYSIKRSKKEKLDLSLVFLNGFAHIQHHYMLTSEFFNSKNPSWYVSDDKDYLLEALYIYDQAFKFLLDSIDENDEYFILTGLTQEPFKNPFIYWRFKNHNKVLSHFVNKEIDIIPRMTRDFEIKVHNKKSIQNVIKFLNEAKISGDDKKNAFGFIDQTSSHSVFASFIYSGETKDIDIEFQGKSISLKNELDFIAIKNAGHDQRGWLISNTKSKYSNIKLWNSHEVIFNKTT